jgi:protein TonB
MLSKFTENINRNLNSRTPKGSAKFKMPAVTRVNKDFVSLKKGIIIGFILHPVVIAILWLVIVILAIFGIDLSIIQKPEPKVNDIEFVLVDNEQTPKDKNTKFRADMNSRTGGVNDPTKPVSMPSPKPSAKPSPSSSPSPAPKKSIADKIVQSVAPKPTQNKVPPKATTTQKNVTPSPTVEQSIPKPQAARPQPPTAKPSVRPPMSTPKAVQKPTNSPFKVPVPSGGTSVGQYATGPISGSGSSKNGGTKGSGTYSPNPSFAPVGNGSGTKTAYGSGAGKGTGTGTGSGSGSGSGAGGGNPGGGGGRPGIDAIREPDFGPYMKELQRRIKMYWDPPKGDESKRVVLLFKIAKDGRLLSCSVFKSSGLQNADNAAINAVKSAAPFRPLPAEYKGQNIDIQFTFDYNVFGAKKY